jgi:uncharacterized protein YacL
MTPRTLLPAVRIVFGLCCLLLGMSAAQAGGGFTPLEGAGFGALFAAAVVGIDLLLRNLTLRSFSAGTFGLMIGIFCAWLVNSIPWNQGGEGRSGILQLAVYLGLGYMGTSLALRSNRQEFSLIIPYVRFRNEGIMRQPLLVDTNIIIDGRLPGICATGFLDGTLIVPRFVLDELHVLADSQDGMKRERGRRGLECLEELQRARGIEVTLHEDDQPQEKLVDTKLIQLARSLDARLLTNDANLGRVAQLQGVSVLNLNQLAHAMRMVVNAGDELELALVREGRDEHQAVGYLGDGTMIVVNHARDRLGSTVPVVVSSALQTSAGRLVFAELKGGRAQSSESVKGRPGPRMVPG